MTALTIETPAGVGAQLATLVRPWRAMLAVVALAAVAAALLDLVPPLVMRQVVDDHLVTGEDSGLLALAIVYLGATAGVQLLTFVYGYASTVVAQRALHALRVRLLAHAHRLPMRYFDRTSIGDVISRCTADVETIDELFSSGVATVIGELLRLVTIAIAMVVLSPALSALAAVAVPVLVAVTRFFQTRVREAQRRQRRTMGALNTRLQEDLGGIEVIHAFAREDVFVQRFRKALRDNLAALVATASYNAVFLPLMSISAAAVTATLLWAGARDGLAAVGASLGTLTAFVLLFQRFFKPIINVGDEWQTVQSALAGAERIFEFLAEPPDAGATSGPVLMRRDAAPIRVTDLVFGYAVDRPVLRGVSFEVARGEHVALVGRTGAGKSSIIHLLAGLYEPWSGGVRVAGVDPRLLSEDERRHSFAAAPQSVQLFTGSVLENLRLRDETVPREVVVAAAEIVGLDSVIGDLPRGYDTDLSGSGRAAGAQLSAGQRQLLALARALVWHPAVLLLDEATAAVDGATEAAITAALRRVVLARGCAILTVAHRLATARAADRVIVLDAGRVVEEGTPAELLREGGRFAALVELEAAGWQTET